jgi:hypothetical protein
VLLINTMCVGHAWRFTCAIVSSSCRNCCSATKDRWLLLVGLQTLSWSAGATTKRVMPFAAALRGTHWLGFACRTETQAQPKMSCVSYALVQL